MQFISDLIISKTEFYITILVVISVLSLYQFLLNVWKLKENNETALTRKVLLTRLSGFVLFGIIPLAVIYLFSQNNLDLFGFEIRSVKKMVWWIVPLFPVLITVTYFNSKQKKNLLAYPQIRKRNWTPGLLFLSMSTWVLYLIAYEFLFRGYLLLVSITFLGIWPAVILNIIIYSVAHFPKGIKETVMAIPFGLVLSFSVIHTGNIWTAVILHSILALSTEWFSLKAHPEMKLLKKEPS